MHIYFIFGVFASMLLHQRSIVTCLSSGYIQRSPTISVRMTRPLIPLASNCFGKWALKCSVTGDWDGKAFLAPEDFIGKIFGHLVPVPYLSKRIMCRNSCAFNLPHGIGVEFGSDDDLGCVLPDPSKSMAIPLVSLNVDEATNLVYQTAMIDPSAVRKPVIGTVRGMGSGKSRMLEEIRRNFLSSEKYDNVLPIAVTFNYNSKLDVDESFFENLTWLNFRILFSLSIVARMASSYYGINFEEIMDTLTEEKSLRRLSMKGGNLKIARELIREFVRLMVRQMAAADHPVDTFVLQVDESLAVTDFFREFYHSDNILSILSGALLDKSLPMSALQGSYRMSPAPIINTALVMTMLRTDPSGSRTASSLRVVERLNLPQTLDIEQIVDRLWMLSEAPDGSTVRTAFQLLAATMSDLPRVVEQARDFIIHCLVTLETDGQREALYNEVSRGGNTELQVVKIDKAMSFGDQIFRCVDRQFLAALISYVAKKINARYWKRTLTSTEVLAAIVFNDLPVTADERIMEAVQYSIITSQPDLPPIPSMEVAITAKASLFMLWTAAKNDENQPLAKPLLRCFDRVMSFLESSVENKYKEGDSLEVICREWLRFRFEVAAEAFKRKNNVVGGQSITLGRILGVPADLKDNLGHLSALHNSHLKFTAVTEHRLTRTSYDARNHDSVQQLRDIPVSLAQPIAFICPPEKKKKLAAAGSAASARASCADHSDTGASFADTSSGAGVGTGADVDAGAGAGAGAGARARARVTKEEAWDLSLKVLLPESTEPMYIFIDNKSALEKGTISFTTLNELPNELPKKGKQYNTTRQLMNDYGMRFLYIYATTHQMQSAVIDGAVYLGYTDTIAMLGPLGELCRVARSHYALNTTALAGVRQASQF